MRGSLGGQRSVISAKRGSSGSRGVAPENEPSPEGKSECPAWFDDARKAVWTRYIVPLYWLTIADEPKAIMWCNLWSEYLREQEQMKDARLHQMRCLGTELGMDPAIRPRMNDGGKKKLQSAFSKFT